VIGVLPQLQPGENSILRVNDSVAIALICWLVEVSEGKKPLGFGEACCGVKLPNSSDPLSTRPFPFRSRTRNAFVDPIAVHATCTGVPSAKISNTTPFAASVSKKPDPSMSTIIGEGLHPPS
jgi:hypothetical protein